MEFRIVPIALTWSMDDETVNRFFPCNLVFSDRLSVLLGAADLWQSS